MHAGIAWIGIHPLGRALAALHPRTAFIDVKPGDTLGWEDIVSRAGFAPDVVVYADQSTPPPLPGVHAFPGVTLFYCVDSHIHSWYPAYAAAFDFCAVSLKDHLPLFERTMGPGRAFWLPPIARPEDAPGQPVPEWDVLFVGKSDPLVTPGRTAFLSRLGELLPGLQVRQGDYRDLYPKARVVLNVAEAGDLNFRVFEALACGACLLTPEVGHGQAELFTHGEHLFTYPSMDAEACAGRARALLADPELREHVARAGLAEVRARHSPVLRAGALLDWLETAARPASRLNPASARELRAVLLHWAQALAPGAQAGAMLKAARNLPSAQPGGSPPRAGTATTAKPVLAGKA